MSNKLEATIEVDAASLWARLQEVDLPTAVETLRKVALCQLEELRVMIAERYEVRFNCHAL